MKFITLSAASLAAITLAACAAEEAAAEGIGGSAQVEYSVESETFSMEAGPDLTLGDFTVGPRAYASVTDSVISFDGVGGEAEYDLGSGLSAYAATQFDGDFDYTDAQVGVRFSF